QRPISPLVNGPAAAVRSPISTDPFRILTVAVKIFSPSGASRHTGATIYAVACNTASGSVEPTENRMLEDLWLTVPLHSLGLQFRHVVFDIGGLLRIAFLQQCALVNGESGR